MKIVGKYSSEIVEISTKNLHTEWFAVGSVFVGQRFEQRMYKKVTEKEKRANGNEEEYSKAKNSSIIENLPCEFNIHHEK